MIEYIKKADVLEILNAPFPRDLAVDYIYELKGVWLDEDDTPQTDCKKCKNFATDKCRECYGNQYFEDSGYTTEMANTAQTEREGSR